MDAPRRIGRYEIIGRLAMGGMAEILLGRLKGPQGFERPIVVKRMLPHLVGAASMGAMFIDEARVASRIQHANVVQVLELGQEGDEYFIAMEYVEGETAATLVRRMLSDGKRLPFQLAAHIVAEACAGLHAAHELRDTNGANLGVVHRDVSPQNLLITYFGACKVADFGIATGAHRLGKATETGELKGKLMYMSPEQVNGLALDRRTDVFALGAILYELTTNRQLFKRPTPVQVVTAICSAPVVKPSRVVDDYPPVLEKICMRALARDPSERYETAAALRADLLAAMHSLGGVPDPAVELARLMNELFPERISEKSELLRQVREGSIVSHIPTADDGTLVDVDLPSAIDTTALVPARRARSRAWVWASAAAALVSALIVGVAWPHAPRAAEASSADFASAPPPPPTPIASVVFPAPEPTIAPAAPARSAVSTDVALHVETMPAGAAVRVGGRDAGRTPCDLRVPKSKQDVRVEIRLRGFATVVQNIPTDTDQRLIVPLRRSASVSSVAPARPPAQTAPNIPVFPD